MACVWIPPLSTCSIDTLQSKRVISTFRNMQKHINHHICHFVHFPLFTETTLHCPDNTNDLQGCLKKHNLSFWHTCQFVHFDMSAVLHILTPLPIFTTNISMATDVLTGPIHICHGFYVPHTQITITVYGIATDVWSCISADMHFCAIGDPWILLVPTWTLTRVLKTCRISAGECAAHLQVRCRREGKGFWWGIYSTGDGIDSSSAYHSG